MAKLAAGGHSVRVLTRDVGRARAKLPYGRLQFYGQSEWASAIDGATAVVNLAGQHLDLGITFICRGRSQHGSASPRLVHNVHSECMRVAASSGLKWDPQSDGAPPTGLQVYSSSCAVERMLGKGA